jgi:hypothetical protein
MTKEERQAFIKEHIQAVQTHVLLMVSKMPDTWDGLELKQYVSDSFNITPVWWRGKLKRKKEYNNDVMVNNL